MVTQLGSEGNTMVIFVEFSGGLEVLFANKRRHRIDMARIEGPDYTKRLSDLIDHLCNKVMTDKRKDMFVLDGNVRPGILVLINDADWELDGGQEYELNDKDNILFVSTLHGG